MATKGEATKDRLLDIAERYILQHGFAATSIEDLIKEAGITKGGFFYHFEGKNALAYAKGEHRALGDKDFVEFSKKEMLRLEKEFAHAVPS